ncbi:MAG: nucleotidyltransferase [Candidatus Saccharimonadales bacterium]
MSTRSITAGFDDFHARLTPSDGESLAAASHRATIKSCVERNFGLNRFFRSGSFGSGTSISGFSDVDYIASVPNKSLKANSSTTLGQFRQAFETTFPRTGVFVDSPAIVLPFGTDKKETTEVVPADFITNTAAGFAIYDIADGHGGWMRSSPEAHNAYVTTVNKDKNFKVKPLVRFLKAWKFYNNVPISSFYLEMRVAKYASGETTIVYDIDVKNVFKLLYDNDLAMMRDPTGVAGYIEPCRSDADYKEAMSKLSTAYGRALKAREAEMDHNTSLAFDWWNKLYSGHFPGYYY